MCGAETRSQMTASTTRQSVRETVSTSDVKHAKTRGPPRHRRRGSGVAEGLNKDSPGGHATNRKSSTCRAAQRHSAMVPLRTSNIASSELMDQAPADCSPRALERDRSGPEIVPPMRRRRQQLRNHACATSQVTSAGRACMVSLLRSDLQGRSQNQQSAIIIDPRRSGNCRLRCTTADQISCNSR